MLDRETVYFDSKLSKSTISAMERAGEEYNDELFECNYIPERVGELLEQEYGVGNIAIKEFWVDEDGSTETEIVSEMLDFCMNHKIKSFTVEFDDIQEIVYAVCLLEKEN